MASGLGYAVGPVGTVHSSGLVYARVLAWLAGVTVDDRSCWISTAVFWSDFDWVYYGPAFQSIQRGHGLAQHFHYLFGAARIIF